MKLCVCLFAAMLAACAGAGPQVRLDDYADSVRRRVVDKIREALGGGRGTDEVAGVVTLVKNGRFYVQSGSCGIKVLSNGKLPGVGNEVKVSGRPTVEGGRVVFEGQGWRKTGDGALPAPQKADSARLTSDGRPGVNAVRVVVEGRAIGRTESGFAIKVDDVPVNVMAEDFPDFLDDCDRLHPLVRVTGVADQMLDSSALLGRDDEVIGIKIDVGTAADIELVPDLSYLAARRDRTVVVSVVSLLCVLAVGLVVFLVVLVRQRRGLFRTQTIMAERKRMADDIHDTIEQHLVGAGMLLKINRLAEAQEVLVRSKREIRDIVWGLKNDDMMRQTPAEMIRQLAHEENTKGLYRVDTRLEGLPEKMDAAAMRDLSLIVREVIGNAVKHGGAKKIAISSDPLEGGGWLMRLSNDGTPFDPSTSPGAKEGHFGLEGMKQRARRIGATVSFEQRGKGMVVVLEKKNMV